MRNPPRSIEAELGLIGSVLIDDEAMVYATDISPEDFSTNQHSVVWRSIKAVYERGDSIDIVSLSDELNRQGNISEAGGYAAISDFTHNTPTSVNAKSYADSVRTKATLRRLISAATRVAEIAYQDPADADEALDRAEAEIYKVARAMKRSDFSEMHSLIDDAISRLDWTRHNKGSAEGVRSGISTLDHITGGWQKSDLTIIAARPSVGKTSLALNIAQHAAIKEGKRVAVFSLEMSKDQLTTRLMAGVSGVDIFRIRRGEVEGFDLARIAASVH
jgi:replicative DNA helicase